MAKRKFPTTQDGIMMLAQEMMSGFAKNPTVFPNPPIDVAAQGTRLNSTQGSINNVVAAEATRKSATQTKDGEIGLLSDEMKENIEYAEFIAQGDDAILKLISWSARAAPQKQQPPTQARLFEIIKFGAGWFKADWKDPIGGGRVEMYKILRRELNAGGDMKEAGSSVISEATLVDQPRGVELEYTVIAVNKAGESEPSNSVTITL